MKSLAFGILFFALAFCGLGDRLKNMQENLEQEVSRKIDGPQAAEGLEVETPILTPEQQKIIESGTSKKWEEQGITFTVPIEWKPMSANKDMFNHGSPLTGFLIGSVSNMPANFPVETSLNAVYESSLDKMKLDEYENVRWLEIDGVKGIEWIESPPEEDGDTRRHQWIAFRNYQGQTQQLTIILSTKNADFDDQRDVFAAILYSMKIPVD